MSVREASRYDRDSIIVLMKEFHSRGGFDFQFDAARVAALVDSCIEDENRVAIVAGDPVHAVFLGEAVDSFLAKMRIGNEIAMWIREDHRGGTLFDDMVVDFEIWSRLRECRRVQISTQHHLRGEALNRALERKGYRLSEYTHTKVL